MQSALGDVLVGERHKAAVLAAKDPDLSGELWSAESVLTHAYDIAKVAKDLSEHSFVHPLLKTADKDARVGGVGWPRRGQREEAA